MHVRASCLYRERSRMQADHSNSQGDRAANGGMSCRQIVELVTEYLEGSLSRKDTRRFEEHIEECPYCATYLDQMRQTIVTLGELREESLEPEVREQLVATFRDWRSRQAG